MKSIQERAEAYEKNQKRLYKLINENKRGAFALMERMIQEDFGALYPSYLAEADE